VGLRRSPAPAEAGTGPLLGRAPGVGGGCHQMLGIEVTRCWGWMSPDVVAPEDRNFKNQSLYMLVGFYPKPGGLDIANAIKTTFHDRMYPILFLLKFPVGCSLIISCQ